jgi:hypothetical protein
MIPRHIATELHLQLREYPVVTILGPRQAGKTTLARGELPGYAYCSLETPETRHFAAADPKGFLQQFKDRVILDEIQRAPELLSYIQAIVDSNRLNGQFVLTGSHQLALGEAIAQSLAGRTSILSLYPFSIAELAHSGIRFESPAQYVVTGFLPRIYDQGQRPTPAYSNYFQTYVERDVRQLINLKDLALFERFMKLLAGRVGQLMDYSSLANDVGVSTRTLKNWLSILEASYIVFRLPPYFESFGKRVLKSPKYYFVEVGLLAFLLGIESIEQVDRDPLAGQMFENLVVIECLKARANTGKLPNLYFYRDSNGYELDLLVPTARDFAAIEIKRSSTYRHELSRSLRKAHTLSPRIKHAILAYGGERFAFSEGMLALPFAEVGDWIRTLG